VELFRLDSDPYERTNLAEQNPQKTGELLEAARRFRAQRPRGGVPPMTAPPPEGWKAPTNWQMRVE
jgi:hypothetical protein